jgi:hypothetical protein
MDKEVRNLIRGFKIENGYPMAMTSQETIRFGGIDSGVLQVKIREAYPFGKISMDQLDIEIDRLHFMVCNRQGATILKQDMSLYELGYELKRKTKQVHERYVMRSQVQLMFEFMMDYIPYS